MGNTKTAIAVAYGDGIGPEIMTASLTVLLEAGAKLEIHPVSIGEKVYLEGNTTGIEAKTWDILEETKVFFKAPITTPLGGGYKSLNVATRKRLGLYANVRPCVSYFPFINSKHPKMNLVIIRENEEDLYAGIEYRQTEDVAVCLKLISKLGCQRIVRYAFEYAKANGRKKVTCFTKDNIMKLTDGMFHSVFKEIGEEYPQIEKDHWIVDIGAAKIANSPEGFDVVVMPNLYGDIISDIAAEITGSVGLVGTANIGKNYAMFEAIHGSAPKIAGKGIANPSALILAGVQMLVHLGQTDVAQRVHNAWLCTIEEGVHTPDIFVEGVSKKKVSTHDFAKAVIEKLGKSPQVLDISRLTENDIPPHITNVPTNYTHQRPTKKLVGIDVFIEWPGDVAQMAHKIKGIKIGSLALKTINNKGIIVWPEQKKEVVCVDQYQCRFLAQEEINLSHCIELLSAFNQIHLPFLKIENLYQLNGENAFSSDE